MNFINLEIVKKVDCYVTTTYDINLEEISLTEEEIIKKMEEIGGDIEELEEFFWNELNCGGSVDTIGDIDNQEFIESIVDGETYKVIKKGN